MMSEFQDELERLINRHSIENGSDTPDFILAAFLTQVLLAWNAGVMLREQWYGRSCGEPSTGTVS